MNVINNNDVTNILINNDKTTIIFDYYNNEFISISKTINDNIIELENNCINIDKISTLKKYIKLLLSEANEIINQIQLNIKNHDDVIKNKLTQKFEEHKNTYMLLLNKFETTCNKVSKTILLTGSKSTNQHQRMLNINQKLSNQSETIINAINIVNETIDVANNISMDLKENQEKINSIQKKTITVASIIDTARRISRSINQRIF